METEELVRAALGRVASIGDLYDARSDKFCNINLFKKTPPASVIRVTDNPSFDYRLVKSDTYEDKFDKLDVGGELKVSILAGLFSVGFSGEYLTNQKESERAVRSSLIYNIQTKIERINLLGEELRDYFSTNALNSKTATHVVVEVGWGANSTITMEHKNKENKDVKEIGGKLQGQLELLRANSSGGANHTTTQGKEQEEYELRVFGDVIPTEEVIPQTFGKALNLLKRMPQLVQSANDGKGKPLKYIMMPLTTLQKHLMVSNIEERMINSIDEQSIIKFVQLFDKISEMKQPLYDLHKKVNSHKHCVPYERIESIDKLKNQVDSAEANLRSKLAKLLVEVRSGNSGAEVLEALIEETVSGDLPLYKIRNFIKSCSDIVDKINFIEILTEEGITYIGEGNDGTSLDMVKLKNVTGEIYVLFFEESEKDDTSTLQNLSDNKHHFLRIIESEKEQSVNLDTIKTDHQKCINSFVAVDLQMRPELVNQEGIDPGSRICLFKNGKYISLDVLSEFITSNQKCLARYKSDKKELATTKPKKRVILKLRCPGSLSGYCDKQEHTWSCYYCGEPIDHGFDDYFYCDCGKARNDCYLFKCNSDSHGAEYLDFKKKELNQLLSEISSMKEMNILILGETGVGKSTWINAIVNYITYGSLDDAAKNKSVSVIGASFKITDENLEEREIKTRIDPNEVTEDGQSATQSPKAYVIDWRESLVRLIDTPGIGDTRGIEQDKKNVDVILRYIASFQELHGICILLKPNSSRLTVMFQFCIKELLTHLHKSASDNIVFCFTNARSTFYRPGDTMPALKRLLEDNINVNIEMSKDKIYCLDNESFRFLCTKHDGVQVNDDETRTVSESWNKSVSETNRMFEHFDGLKPHSTKDTISLNHARNVIFNLTRPMADISKNIQRNIAIMDDKKEEISNSDLSLKDLSDKLYVPQIVLVAKKLETPRTVCTSSRCVKYHLIPGTKETQIEYVTHCHVSCGLNVVEKESYPNADLKKCTAMDENFKCKRCKCSWDRHMNTEYEYNLDSKDVMDQTVQNLINSKKSDVDKVNIFISKLMKDINELEKEQEQITKVSVNFGCFLKANAISPYNDALKEYLQHLIKQEKEKGDAGDQKSLKRLEGTLNNYIEEVRVMEMSLTKGDNAKPLTPNDINEMVKRLFSLPINGKQLENSLKVSLMSRNSMLTETRYRPQEHPLKSVLRWYKSLRK